VERARIVSLKGVMKPSRWSLAVGLAWSVAVFSAINCVVLTRRAYCFDCGFARGVPFILFHDGGFPFISRWVDWTGLLADSLVALASGVILEWLIHLASRRFGAAR
jgi:hypothetical protein